MNPIEHIWDMLGKRIASHSLFSETAVEKLSFTVVGENISVHTDNLIDSIPCGYVTLFSVKKNYNPH